jgi:hypothetical protein
MKSWKTTAAGIAGIVAAVALAVSHQFDADPTTAADWGAALAALSAGVGLLFARDDDGPGEKAPAK